MPTKGNKFIPRSLGATTAVFVNLCEAEASPTFKFRACPLAAKVGVSRRRLYDVINILEVLNAITRVADNFFMWMGLPEIAAKLCSIEKVVAEQRSKTAGPVKCPPFKQSASLCIITQAFLYNMVGTKVEFSVQEVARKVALSLASESKRSGIERRIYDCISVLSCLGVVKRSNKNEGQFQSASVQFIPECCGTRGVLHIRESVADLLSQEVATAPMTPARPSSPPEPIAFKLRSSRSTKAAPPPTVTAAPTPKRSKRLRESPDMDVSSEDERWEPRDVMRRQLLKPLKRSRLESDGFAVIGTPIRKHGPSPSPSSSPSPEKATPTAPIPHNIHPTPRQPSPSQSPIRIKVYTSPSGPSLVPMQGFHEHRSTIALSPRITVFSLPAVGTPQSQWLLPETPLSDHSLPSTPEKSFQVQFSPE